MLSNISRIIYLLRKYNQIIKIIKLSFLNISNNHLIKYINVSPPLEYRDSDNYDLVFQPDINTDKYTDEYGYDLIPGTI